MSRQGTILGCLAVAAAALGATPAPAQGTFRLVVDRLTESRARTATNETSGRLTLMPKLEGEGLAEAKAFRLRVAAAKDDTGRVLLPDEPEPSPWEENPAGPGLWIAVQGPARAASSVTVSGTLELWTPGRDPGAEVKVPKGLARPGRPIAAPGLRDAGVSLTVAPRGAGDASVVLSGKTVDVDRVRSVRLLAPDGAEVAVTGLQRSSDGAKGTLELLLASPPPADAILVLGLLTKKSVLAVPFELESVPLP